MLSLVKTRNLFRIRNSSVFLSTAQQPKIEIEISANTASTSAHSTNKNYLKQHQIIVTGQQASSYAPIVDFHDAPFVEAIKNVLKREGFTAPTPIQAQSWPIALDKRDLISVARTGSGKTVGFLLPALQRIVEKRESLPKPASTERGVRRFINNRTPQVLVLAPTRELAVQIESEASKYCLALNLKSVVVYGGIPKGSQISALRTGADLVIATPGRCNDLMALGALDLSSLSYLVLDEADRMLDMGFEPQIRQVIDGIPPDRQTLFFTATWPKVVQSLAHSFLKNPVEVKIGDLDVLNANKAIKQNIIVVKEAQKYAKLFEVLESDVNPNGKPADCPKTLIFVARKAGCEDLVNDLISEGYAADSLHGDVAQTIRTNRVERFKSGRLRVLVATDVAARGLDIKDIENVINFDFPNDIEDYVHRIGRTARGNNSGTSYTFISPTNSVDYGELISLLKRCNQEISADLTVLANSSKLGRASASKSFSRYGNTGGGGKSFAPRSYDNRPTDIFRYENDRSQRSLGDRSQGDRFSSNSYSRPISRIAGGDPYGNNDRYNTPDTPRKSKHTEIDNDWEHDFKSGRR
eukprot:gene12983-17408_t